MNKKVNTCCGHNPQMQSTNKIRTFIIRCESCGTLAIAKDQEGALEKWNKMDLRTIEEREHIPDDALEEK